MSIACCESLAEPLNHITKQAAVHPFPPAADLEWLRGDRLDVVCTAEFTIWFTFDSKGVIQSHIPVTFIGSDAAPQIYIPEKRQGVWLFHLLIGRKVSDVRRTDDMTLELAFEGGLRLITKSNGGPYETGRIAFPKGSPDAFF